MNRSIFTFLLIPLIFMALCATVQAVNYGETFNVGTTWWFNQQNSTVGKMIVRDENGGVHFVWTWGNNPRIEQRHVRYNFCYDDGGDIADQLDDNSSQVDNDDRAGYASLDFLRDGDIIRPVAFFHIFGRAALAYDWDWGLGAFSTVYLDSPDNSVPMVLKGALDRNGSAHVISGAHTMEQNAVFPLMMWHVEPNDDFSEWDVSQARIIDETTGLSHHIKASRTSENVGLVWHHNILGVPAPDGWENTVAYTMNNDLYLIESEDGQEWDYNNPFNITRTIPPDPRREDLLAYGDTLRPYNDTDILYLDDIVHVVFSVRGFWADLEMNEEPPVERITFNESLIWHWDSESDSLTLVADGWYENAGSPGSMHNNVSRPSLGVDEDGKMYCLFRQVTEDDRNGADYCYGELMLSVSEDNGITWSEAINLTGTVAENEEEVEYIDECHPCLAELVDENLHLYYLLAPESDESPDEGPLDECIMTYQIIPVEDLPDVNDLPLPRDNFTYHNYPPQTIAHKQSPAIPRQSSIKGVYPNPFNDRAEIVYGLAQRGDVNFTLYDSNGKVLLREYLGILDAGRHKYEIKSSEIPAGIYFTRMALGGQVVTRKVVCLK